MWSKNLDKGTELKHKCDNVILFLSQCLPFVGIRSLVKLEHYLLSSGFSSVEEQGFLKHDVTVSEVVPVDLFPRGLLF